MPDQEISQPNPPPDASLLPDSLLDLRVQLDVRDVLSHHELTAIQKFRRAANYVTAGASILDRLSVIGVDMTGASYDIPEIKRSHPAEVNFR